MVLTLQSDNMPTTSIADPILSQADKKEKEHDWLGAAETYSKGLDSTSAQNLWNLGELRALRLCLSQSRDAS